MEEEFVLPEWKVYFDSYFIQECPKQRGGLEIPVKQKYIWGNDTWFILSVYLCEEGIELDLC